MSRPKKYDDKPEVEIVDYTPMASNSHPRPYPYMNDRQQDLFWQLFHSMPKGHLAMEHRDLLCRYAVVASQLELLNERLAQITDVDDLFEYNDNGVARPTRYHLMAKELSSELRSLSMQLGVRVTEIGAWELRERSKKAQLGADTRDSGGANQLLFRG